MNITEYIDTEIKKAQDRIVDLEERRKLIELVPEKIRDINTSYIGYFFEMDGKVMLAVYETDNADFEHNARLLGMKPAKPTYSGYSWTKEFTQKGFELNISAASEPLNCKVKKVMKEREEWEVECPEFNGKKKEEK